jgi:hypothetical protein
MKPWLQMLVAGTLAVVATGAVMGAEIGGLKLDDKTTVGTQELVLNGAGIRTRAFFKVYVASLYLPQKAVDLAGVLAKNPRRIQLNMLRTLSADQLAEALNEGLVEANSPADVVAVKAQAEQLLAIMKAFKEVKENDIVTLDFVDGATKVAWNGATKGTIPGEPFNQALTKIWIGNNPVQTDLKKALLGG